MPHSQKFSKHISMGPLRVWGGVWGLSCCLFCDKCFYFLGDMGFIPSLWTWQGCSGRSWPQASEKFLPYLLFICWKAMVTSGTTSHSCLDFSLLDPAGLIPGAGWVWEEDQDSWDSLAGGLLAWSRAQLLSHPCHSLPQLPSSWLEWKIQFWLDLEPVCWLLTSQQLDLIGARLNLYSSPTGYVIQADHLSCLSLCFLICNISALLGVEVGGEDG